MSSIGLVESAQGVRVHVAMKFRKRSGRKQIIVPEGLDNANDSTPNYHESLVVAISRAHRWKKMLDDGKYRSMADLARALNMNRYCLARMLRLTLLAPEIIEDILDGPNPTACRSGCYAGQCRRSGGSRDDNCSIALVHAQTLPAD